MKDKITELKMNEANNEDEESNNSEEWLNMFNDEKEKVRIFDLSNAVRR